MGPIAVLNDASHTMTFDFSTPVQAVGGFLNYCYYADCHHFYHRGLRFQQSFDRE